MLKINMKQMNRWKVDTSNIRQFDSIMRTNGKIITLDIRPYVDSLQEFGIFYTRNLD